MKICAYVQDKYAKQTYANECMDTRQFVGLRVIIDCIERAGYQVDYAGIATVHQYDVVLVSITSDCDWWPYVMDRIKWRKGNYKVIIGGAGVLHITPFIPFGDYFVLGRGENVIQGLIKAIDAGDEYEGPSIVNAKTFKMSDCLFGGIEDKELAMLDLVQGKEIDFAHLRTTAIDGLSERIRKMVNKPITREIMVEFFETMIGSGAKPHMLKIYNIVGYPTETIEDWEEYRETIRQADLEAGGQSEKRWWVVLHSTPFRPMPATPLACCKMSKTNYRGRVSRALGNGLPNGKIYDGNNLYTTESMWTESLPTVMLSAIAHRGEEYDTENIIRLCSAKKFWGASVVQKEATLSKYFNMDKLFGEFTPETLPSRYLRTYAKVENMWGKTCKEDSGNAQGA